MVDAPERLAARLVALAKRAPGDGPVVELAVGRRPGVARVIATRGLDVVATDLRDREVPDDVDFVRDDLTDPEASVYADATLLYARNLPAELQRPALKLADGVDAPLVFTTLGAEEPTIPVERETVGTATLYRAGGGPGGT